MVRGAIHCAPNGAKKALSGPIGYKHLAALRPGIRRATYSANFRNSTLDDYQWLCWLLAGTQQKHVPGPATKLRVVRVPDLRSIAERVAILIGALRYFVIQINR